MDAFPATASPYSLLRAWVQDDPYRYTFPDVLDPARLKDEMEDNNFRPKVVRKKREFSTVPTNTTLVALKKNSDEEVKTSSLLDGLIQRGKKRRKLLGQRLAVKDKAVLEQIEGKGFFR